MINVQHVHDFDDDESTSDLHLSCFAHTLQLSMRDGLKRASHVPRLLDKCQTMI
jgi:hypothetical protein